MWRGEWSECGPSCLKWFQGSFKCRLGEEKKRPNRASAGLLQAGLWRKVLFISYLTSVQSGRVDVHILKIYPILVWTCDLAMRERKRKRTGNHSAEPEGPTRRERGREKRNGQPQHNCTHNWTHKTHSLLPLTGPVYTLITQLPKASSTVAKVNCIAISVLILDASADLSTSPLTELVSKGHKPSFSLSPSLLSLFFAPLSLKLNASST